MPPSRAPQPSGGGYQRAVAHVLALPVKLRETLAAGHNEEMTEGYCHVCNALGYNCPDELKSRATEWLMNWHGTTNPVRCGVIYGIAAASLAVEFPVLPTEQEMREGLERTQRWYEENVASPAQEKAANS